MKLIEPINDSTLFGIGILTIETPFASRSLLGLFWRKEGKGILVDILFLNIKIRIS